MSRVEKFGVPVTRQRIGELFTTCMEGGSSGWIHGAEIARGTSAEARAAYVDENVLRVRRGERPLVWWGHAGVWEADDLTVELHYDREEDDDGAGRGRVHIRISGFVAGFALMAQAGELQAERLGRVAAGDYDAADADEWMQFVVLGKVVYG